MKATDLMIGDWVMAIDTPSKVEAIDFVSPKEEIWCATAGDGCNPLAPNKISPIPLTDEILAKNGFVQNNDHRVLYVHMGDYNGYALALDADNAGWHLTDNKFVTIDSVHELQHLLHLCGIEKEVVI